MGDLKGNLAFHLFARPSFVEGMARIMDLSGSLQTYNYSETGEQADAKATYNDWKAVGKDIESAIREHEQEK